MVFFKKIILILMVFVPNTGLLLAAAKDKVELTKREREAIDSLMTYGSWQRVARARAGLECFEQPSLLTVDEVAKKARKALLLESNAKLPYDVAAIIVNYLDKASLVQCGAWGPGRVPQLVRERVSREKEDINRWQRRIDYDNKHVQAVLRRAVDNNDVALVAQISKLVDPNEAIREETKVLSYHGYETVVKTCFLYNEVLDSNKDDDTKIAMMGSFLDAGLNPATLAQYLGKYHDFNGGRHLVSEKVCDFFWQRHVPVDGEVPVDERNSGEITPLMRVVRQSRIHDQQDRVEWLLNHGADKHLRYQGETAADLALDPEIAKLIRNYGVEERGCVGEVSGFACDIPVSVQHRGIISSFQAACSSFLAPVFVALRVSGNSDGVTSSVQHPVLAEVVERSDVVQETSNVLSAIEVPVAPNADDATVQASEAQAAEFLDQPTIAFLEKGKIDIENVTAAMAKIEKASMIVQEKKEKKLPLATCFYNRFIGAYIVMDTGSESEKIKISLRKVVQKKEVERLSLADQFSDDFLYTVGNLVGNKIRWRRNEGEHNKKLIKLHESH